MRAWRSSIFLATLIACSSFDTTDAPDGPDASTNDGSAPADAAPGTDADVDAGDAGPPRGCAGRPQDPAHFCDDFDTAGDIAFLWQHLVSDAGAIVETDAAYSGKRAVQAGFPNGAPAGSTAWLRRQRHPDLNLASKTRLALGFSLKVLDAPYPTGGPGYLHVATLSFDDAACSGDKIRVLEFNFAANGDQMTNLKGLASPVCPDGGGVHFTSFKGPYGMASFTEDFRRVSIVFTKGACLNTSGAASLIVTVDGTSLPCRTLDVNPFDIASRLDLNVGAYAGRDPVTKATFVIDDVTLDAD